MRSESKSIFSYRFWVLIILSAALCLHRLPALALFTTHILGGDGPDTNLYLWLVTTFPESIIKHGWFETNAFHPYQNTLAWSDCFLFPSSVFYILRQLGLAEIPSWNIIILLAQLLNGYCVFLLTNKVSSKIIPSLLVSLIFLSSPYFSEHLGHPQLQFFFFIPLALFFFLGILSPKLGDGNIREQTGIWNYCAFTLTLAASFYTSAYYSIIIALCSFLLFTVKVLQDHKLFKKLILKLCLLGLSVLLLIAPALMPYLSVKKDLGARGLHEFYYFSLEASSFLSNSPLSKLYSNNLLSSHSEAHMFWGLTCLFLILISLNNLRAMPILSFLLALLLSQKNIFGLDREIRLYACSIFSWLSFLSISLILFREKIKLTSIFSYLGLVLILIALGPLGYPEIGIKAFGPFNLFYNLFPGIDSLRAIGRLGSAAILLLLIGSTETLARFKSKSLILVPVIFLDSLVSTFPLAPLKQKPVIFEDLIKNIQTKQAALIAPISGKLDSNRNIVSWKEVAVLNSQYLVDLRDNPIKLLNGYSGQRPKSIYELPKIMARFPDSKSLELLNSYEDLKWIVVLGSKIENFNRDDFLTRINLLSEQLKIRSQLDNDFLIEIVKD